MSGFDFSHWLLSLSGFQVLLCLPGGFYVGKACNILLFGLLNTPVTKYEVLKL